MDQLNLFNNNKSQLLVLKIFTQKQLSAAIFEKPCGIKANFLMKFAEEILLYVKVRSSAWCFDHLAKNTKRKVVDYFSSTLRVNDSHITFPVPKIKKEIYQYIVPP